MQLLDGVHPFQEPWSRPKPMLFHPTTYFVGEELSKLLHRYAHDGSIHPEGLPLLMADLGIKDLDQSMLDAIVTEVDKDGSGEIDQDEFLSLMARFIVKRDSKEELTKAFKMILRYFEMCFGSSHENYE